MRVVLGVVLISVLFGSVGADGRRANPVELPQVEPRVMRLGGTRDLDDICVSGNEDMVYWWSWYFSSGERYANLNDLASDAVCECCSTTLFLPSYVGFAVVDTGGDGDAVFTVHAELWSSTAGGSPDAIICNGNSYLVQLPDPGEGIGVWTVTLPLDNCTTEYDCPTDVTFFSVVAFDATNDDIFIVTDDVVRPSYMYYYAGGWVDLLGAGFTGTFTSWGEYLCTGEVIAVEMSSLTAVASPDRVEIRWRTETERDNWGFNVYRALEGSERSRINSGLIPGAGTSTVPREYRFVDDDVQPRARLSYWVSDVDLSGREEFHGPVPVAVPAAAPSRLALTAGSWDGSAMKISLQIPSEGKTQLSVFDLAGREVAVLVDQALPTGQAEAMWDGTDSGGASVASGTYIFRLSHNSGVVSKKALLAR